MSVPVTASAATSQCPGCPVARTSSGSSSPMRPKTTLSSTKMTVWYTECRCSRLCAVVIRDRREPITRPATITAVTPETWNVSPGRYAAYGVTRAATVSSTGSVIRRRTAMTPTATTAPTSTPPPASTANSPTPCSRMPVADIPAVPPTARETAIWYSTRLVPSLNKLSACTSVCTLTGSESRRASALTATGSVLAKTAPSTNAMLADRDATATPTAATAAAEASTSPTASTATGRHTARRSRQASSSLAAYSSGGSTTRLTTSGGTSIAGALGSMPTARPTATSREGAGTRSRRAKAATTVASATSNTTVSTVRTPGPPPLFRWP